MTGENYDPKKLLSTRLVKALEYLFKQGMTMEQVYKMHHFSLTDAYLGKNSMIDYFNRTVSFTSLTNINFANRVIWVANEYKYGDRPYFNELIEKALRAWPLK